MHMLDPLKMVKNKEKDNTLIMHNNLHTRATFTTMSPKAKETLSTRMERLLLAFSMAFNKEEEY